MVVEAKLTRLTHKIATQFT